MKCKADTPVVAEQQEEELPENVRVFRKNVCVFMLNNKGRFWGLDLVEGWVILQ